MWVSTTAWTRTTTHASTRAPGVATHDNVGFNIGSIDSGTEGYDDNAGLSNTGPYNHMVGFDMNADCRDVEGLNNTGFDMSTEGRDNEGLNARLRGRGPRDAGLRDAGHRGRGGA